MKNLEKCPNCESSKKTLLFWAEDIETNQPGKFPLYECEECGLNYLGIIPEVHELIDFYPDSYGAYQIELSPIVEIFSRFMGIILYQGKQSYFDIPILEGSYDKTMLDIGAGTGLLLSMYLKNHWRINGIDFNKKVVSEANSKLGGDYVEVGDASNPGFPPKTFDLITASQVLEHLENPKIAIRNWIAMLKDDGMLIIAVPNFDSLPRKLFRTTWYGGLSIPRHFIHFNANTLRSLVEGQGLEVVSCKRVPFPSFGYSILLKVGVRYADLPKRTIFRLIEVLFLPLDLLAWVFRSGHGIVITCRNTKDGVNRHEDYSNRTI